MASSGHKPWQPSKWGHRQSTDARVDLTLQLLDAEISSGQGVTMATRTSKKRRAVKKRGGSQDASVVPSRATRIATELAGRLMQLICIAAVVVGALRLLDFIETAQQWFDNNAGNHELARLWHICALPLLLGATAFWFLEQSLGRLRRMDKSLIENPSEPWLAEQRWNTGTIRLEELIIARRIGYAIVAFLLIVIPGTIAMQWEISRALSFGAGLLTLLYVFNRLRDGKFYSGVLKMQTMPGVLGGQLKAVFVSQQHFEENTIFEATLRCDYQFTSEDSPAHRVRLWSETIQSCSQHAAQDLSSTVVPVCFSIPSQLPASALLPQASDQFQDVRWTLAIEPSGFLSRKSSFQVPVFRTAHSRSTHQADFADQEVSTAPPALDFKSVCEASGLIKFPSSQHGTQWIFHHRARSIIRWSLIALGATVAFMTAIAMLIPRWVDEKSAMALVLFLCLIPAFCTAAFFNTLLDALLWQCRIAEQGRMIVIHYGWKGFRKTYELPRDETTSLSLETFIQKEVGELWNLLIKHPSLPRKIVLLKRIENKREAQLIQERLAASLRIRADPPRE